MWNWPEVQLHCVEGEKVTEKNVLRSFYLLIPLKKRRNLVTFYKLEVQDARWHPILFALQTGPLTKCGY